MPTFNTVFKYGFYGKFPDLTLIPESVHILTPFDDVAVVARD
jgi:hypothetical protein